MRTIRLREDGTTMEVESWPTGVKGLSVVPFVWQDRETEPGWYRLNHDASGLAFPYGWPSRAAVKRVAQAVADTLDWTASFDDLRDHSRLDELREAGRLEGVHESDLSWRTKGKVGRLKGDQ